MWHCFIPLPVLPSSLEMFTKLPHGEDVWSHLLLPVGDSVLTLGAEFLSLQDLQHICRYPEMAQYRLKTSIRQKAERSPRQRCPANSEQPEEILLKRGMDFYRQPDKTGNKVQEQASIWQSALLCEATVVFMQLCMKSAASKHDEMSPEGQKQRYIQCWILPFWWNVLIKKPISK